MMRIVVHDYAGHGFTAQLARALAARDHEVLYLHGGGLRPSRASMEPRPRDPRTLLMEPVGLVEPLHSAAGPRRLLQERRYGTALARRVTSHRPDVVLSVPSSLDAQRAALQASHNVGAGFVYWLQDVYSEAVGQLLGRRAPVAGRLLGASFVRLERGIFRKCDAIVAITDDLLTLLGQWRISSSRIAVIPNWAPLDDLRPMAKTNSWSIEHGLQDKAVFMYAGTLGRKHDPSLLLALADGVPQARVVVVAEGAGANRLRAQQQARKNLLLMPLQPSARLPEVLATADVLVANLDADANVFSVPSKVLTYLAAGRPILAAIRADNLAARTIIAANAGRVVDPSDITGFVNAGRALMEDSDARSVAATAGRAYAVKSFDIEAITDRFEAVLHRARRSRETRADHTSDTGVDPHDARPEAKV